MSENLPNGGRLGAPADSLGESPTRRPHRKTGKKPPGGPRANSGGSRPGAGRPEGSKNTLPSGTVAALNAARIAAKRLGADADPDDLATVTRVYQRVADVLEERVHFTAATSVLKAGAMVADAVAGPLATKVEASGPNGGPLIVEIRDLGREPEET